MHTAAGSRQRTAGTRQRAAILGSVTIPGIPEHVSVTRVFIARTLAAVPHVDSDAATLLTSELVTNAIQHTDSGAPGGTVTVVVIGVPEGVLVEVVDDGSPDTPTVKGRWCAAEGQGLFLVQQLAARWGFLRDPAGTTVWFHLQAGQPDDACQADTPAGADPEAAAVDTPPASDAGRPDAPDGYLVVAASTAASTPAQMAATSSLLVT
jgi:anti-sigma regulatory factor (Ser/Thr protein kinase)